MLGRLAKRLRLLGFDVLYDRTLEDNELIRISLEQQRVILTRDTGLAERPLAGNHLFITSDDVRKQVLQVLEYLPIRSISLVLTRCSLCNASLSPISKEETKNLVPRYVHETNKSFWQCDNCGKIYWQGTHTRRMMINSEGKIK